MLEQKRPKLSVVIPCYNEEENIDRCLQTLAAQTRRVDEIIIVDNNCTDKTVEAAKGYLRVRIVQEKNQGVMAARTTGINAARGDIIARIDADTRPAPHWAAKITELMAPEHVMAVTGSGYFYDFPFKKFSRWFRNIFAVSFNRYALGHEMLWGSNMAIRREAWYAIAPELCLEREICEDLDIAMHLNDNFGSASLVYDAGMQADISVRRAATGFTQNFRYLRMWPRTLKKHRFLRSFITWPAIGFLLAAGSPVVNTVVRFYDGLQNEWVFSRRRLRDKAGFSRQNP